MQKSFEKSSENITNTPVIMLLVRKVLES